MGWLAGIINVVKISKKYAKIDFLWQQIQWHNSKFIEWPENKIGAFDISFTNASLFMVVSSLAILIIFNLGSKKNSILPNKLQLLAELSYSFVLRWLEIQLAQKQDLILLYIFLFMLFCSAICLVWYLTHSLSQAISL